MKYASTFLSHNSADKPLVQAVAKELSRRGIVAWLDINDLTPGLDLCAALKEAIQRQATVCLFLSRQAIQSKWVEEELAIALDEISGSERIIPIYLDDPLELVSSHPLLRSRWLHADGDRVKQLGIVVKQNQNIIDQARDIADKIALGIYDELKTTAQREIILYIDQRGNGKRYGEEHIAIPANVAELDVPILLFRPDNEQRQQVETLYNGAWDDMWRDVKNTLDVAVGNLRGSDPKKIRILGNAQLGFAFFLGGHFNRNTSTHLYCYNQNQPPFNNRDQQRHTPLKGGDACCDVNHSDVRAIPPGSCHEIVSLLLTPENYLAPIVDYLNANSKTCSDYSYWVKHDHFDSNEQVMAYITDVVALLIRLRSEHGVRTIHLFCTLPFHVLPLLGANLLHVMESVIFMEYRRDLQGTGSDVGEMYIPLFNEQKVNR